MLTYMSEVWWNTAGIPQETKVQLQLLPNLQRQAENVIAIRKKEDRRQSLLKAKLFKPPGDQHSNAKWWG